MTRVRYRTVVALLAVVSIGTVSVEANAGDAYRRCTTPNSPLRTLSVKNMSCGEAKRLGPRLAHKDVCRPRPPAGRGCNRAKEIDGWRCRGLFAGTSGEGYDLRCSKGRRAFHDGDGA